MKTKETKGETCCSCNADFKNQINNEVNAVEGYTKEERNAKEKEVEAAFDKKDDQKK